MTYLLLSNAHAALVTSGTATLETALFGVPEVVCYKGSAISFMLAKKLVKVNYISLVNLIMDKEVVKELIQQDFTSENLSNELLKILDKEKMEEMKLQYAELKNKLGASNASAKAAELMTKALKG
jgi:lipid-A-disaccharide synthase